MGIRYRLGQFWRVLTAQPLPAGAWPELEQVLSPSELALYGRYRPGDQWHTYQVMRRLAADGQDNPALLAAALLHDIGKTRESIRLPGRVLVVLVEKLLPGRVAKWGSGEPHGWQRPFVIKMQHPAWGAEMAQAAGSDALTVSLIRRHQDPLPPQDQSPEDQLLRRLQWVDDRH